MTRGSYRHLAQVETPGAATPDGDGGVIESWFPLDPPTWWCSIDSAAIRNSERIMENATVVAASHLLRGDFHHQLRAGCRVLVADPEAPLGRRRFDVVSVQREGERRFSILVGCNEYAGTNDPRPRSAA